MVGPFVMVVAAAESIVAGSLDFFINDQLDLAIELLLDEQKKEEHIQKIGDDVHYQAVLPRFSRIIDFRQNKTCNNPNCDMYISVNFLNDFSQAQVHFFGVAGVRRSETLHFHL